MPNMPKIDGNVKVLEVEAYALELSDSDTWDIDLEEQDYTIKTKIGSEYREDLPVLQLEINLDLGDKVTLADIVNIMTNPEKRMKWDKDGLIEYKFQDDDKTPDGKLLYTISKFPWPMKNRDFLDFRYTKKLPGEIRVIFFGIEHEDYPKAEGIVRGQSIFGMHRYMKIDDKIKIVMVS